MLSDLVGEAGLFHRTPLMGTDASGSLICKGSGLSRPPMRRGPTLVTGDILSRLLRDGAKPAAAPPPPTPRVLTAHQRRAARDKAERHQRRRAHLPDAIAFAHFRRWPLNTTVTVTWDKCRYADPAYGHVLGLPDPQRGKRLRDDLWRALHRAGLPFVATWARGFGGGFGPHLHLGLWWPWEAWELVPLLTRLTGVGEVPKRLRRGDVAYGENGGWHIQENTDPLTHRGALGWGCYQLRQEEQHPTTAVLDGKSLDVSRALSPTAIAPFRQELEAWKRNVGWDRLVQEAHERIA